MLLSVQNQLDSLANVITYTGASLGVGGTVVGVKNIAGLTNQWAQQIGRTGEETAEIIIISGAPSGTTFNTSGTIKYPHNVDTPIYQIHYDQIIFKRSTDGTAGTATALTNGTISITPDSQYTEFDDTSGAVTYAYKTQFRNSVSGDVSAESAWFVPGGPSFYSLQRLRDRGRRNLYNSGYIKEDQTINDWINEWVEKMTNKALKVNEQYSVGTASYAFGTAGLGTITAPLFKYAAKAEVTFDGQTWIPSSEIPLNQFSDQTVISPNAPRHYWQGDTIFGVLPNGSLGTARMTLGQLQTELTDDDDLLPQYLRGYTADCQEYLLYRAKSLDQKDQAAELHYRKYIKGEADFTAESTPRDQTGTKMIDMVEGTGREDDILVDFF